MILRSGELDTGSAFQRAMELRNTLLPISGTCLLTAVVVVASLAYPNYIVPRTEKELLKKFVTFHRQGAVDEHLMISLIEVAGFQPVRYYLLASAAQSYKPTFDDPRFPIVVKDSVQEILNKVEFGIVDSFFSDKPHPTHSDPWCRESDILQERILVYAQRSGRKFAGVMEIKPKYNRDVKF